MPWPSNNPLGLVLLVWDNLNCTLVNTNMYFGSIKKDNNVP